MIGASKILNRHEGYLLKTFSVLPAPPLRNYIESYHTTEYDVSGLPFRYMPPILILPMGRISISFYFDSISVISESIHKQVEMRNFVRGERNLQTQFYMDRVSKANKFVDVMFKPGGFYGLFGILDGEMRNNFFNTDEVVGNELREVEERLNDTSSAEEKIDILDRFFVGKLDSKQRDTCGVSSAVEMILAYNGNIRIDEISKELFVTKRTLERKFISRIGLSPKEFSRIVRFKWIINKILSGAFINWSKLALSCGYYDQSHLIEEFKMATTFTPGVFMANRKKKFVKFRDSIILTSPQNSFSYQWYQKQVTMEAGQCEVRRLL